uniref:BTB domain-containing protein n=1 Tax=Panagrolaimus superbus TaxID=310955 RepID=A0A914YXQ7_9BILA
MKALKLYEYCEDYIILPYHENLKFKYYIKKVKEESVEVCIENPFEIEIGGDYEKGGSLGKKEDYKVMVTNISQNFELKLFFIFSFDEDMKKFNAENAATTNISPPSTINMLPNLSLPPPSIPLPQAGPQLHLPLFNPNVPPPDIPMPQQLIQTGIKNTNTVSPKMNLQKPIFYEIMSSTKYSDVLFVTSDGTVIPSHRNVLSKYSIIFDKIFEKSKEIPVKIHLEKFDADTVMAALNFCYGKSDDCISGKAKMLLEFANAFAINELNVIIQKTQMSL